MADRVTLYIDAQNVLEGARQCFHVDGPTHYTDGQINPVALGNMICERPPPGLTRILKEVRIYTGRPDSSKEPKTYSAHMRQCESWKRAGAIVITRALRYPSDWPGTKARQKGVDVELAIDFIAGAIDKSYDVGIIFSTDTDIRPALEFVASRFEKYPRAETAAWHGTRANRALRARIGQSAQGARSTWVHYLEHADYLAVRDQTDYLLT